VPRWSTRHATAIIGIAAFFCSALWFSINAVADTLQIAWGITPVDLGHLASAVQFGFISGTLLISLSGLADRFAASHIFTICAVIGALANGAVAFTYGGLLPALLLRFVTGMAMAGVYPLGMKLVVTWAPERAGNVLGWLVGMLMVGAGLPHFVRGIDLVSNWQAVLLIASAVAMIGAGMVWSLGDGPHHTRGRRLHWGGVLRTYAVPEFRAAACGYFGHMWELYAFLVMVPIMIARQGAIQGHMVYLTTAAVFLASGTGCIVGGILSRRWGCARIAILALSGSALMCLLYPWLAGGPTPLVVMVLLGWGFLATADSPQFSALASQACPQQLVGSALALMNSIGFGISIASIELVTLAWDSLSVYIAWLLLPGPLLGLLALREMWRASKVESRPSAIG
jgi:MFS family permease